MGTIVPRKRKDGTTGYHAQVLIKRDGRIAYRETRTFDRKAAASAWIDKTEEALLNPQALDRVRQDDPTLGFVIDRYMDESKKEMGRTKKQVLNTLKNDFDITDMACSTIDSSTITSLAKELGKTRGPATVANYLSHLGAVFAIARAAWKYPLDPAVMKDGNLVARKLGLTGKGKERDRRPTLAELDTIMSHYQAREQEVEMLPMTKLVPFAIFSTRRQDEIVSMRWPDLDEVHNRVMVRDMKNPTEKIGNNVWVDLPAEAMKIIKSMPRLEERIFPYSADTVSASFTRACQFLGIEDLHFHDLRHDGISRLFELGLNIPHVATVSGHRSWQSLKRYTHIRQSGDKYKGWKWLAVATAPLGSISKSYYRPRFKSTVLEPEAAKPTKAKPTKVKPARASRKKTVKPTKRPPNADARARSARSPDSSGPAPGPDLHSDPANLRLDGLLREGQMEEIILSVPTTDAEEVAKQLADLDIEAESYTGRAFDGGAVASFIIVMTPLVLPHLVKMYTARQETQRATKLKYKGVELTGASDKLLKTLIDKLDSAKPDKDA